MTALTVAQLVSIWRAVDDRGLVEGLHITEQYLTVTREALADYERVKEAQAIVAKERGIG